LKMWHLFDSTLTSVWLCIPALVDNSSNWRRWCWCKDTQKVSNCVRISSKISKMWWFSL